MDKLDFDEDQQKLFDDLIDRTSTSICKILIERDKNIIIVDCLLCRMIYNKKVILLAIINNIHIGEEDLYKNDKIVFFIGDRETFTSDNIGIIFRENKEDGMTIIEIITLEKINSDSFLEIDFNMLQNFKEDTYINNSVYLIDHQLDVFERKIKNIDANFNNYEIEKLRPSKTISIGNPIFLRSESFKLLAIYKGYNDNSHFGAFIKEPIQEFIKKYNDSILIIYKSYKQLSIKLFGENFIDPSKYTDKKDKIEANKIDELKVIIKGKIQAICESIKLEKQDSQKKYFFIKLINIKNLGNLDFMFWGCNFLYSLPDLEKFNEINLKSIRSLFNGCSKLEKISDISNWNTLNFEDIRYLFCGCESLKEIPDISKWKTDNIKCVGGLFDGCKLIERLPDISKWNTINVEDMSNTFNGLSSLTILPDISNWKTNNVCYMPNMFEGCYKLKKLPDISKWNTSKVINMKEMFKDCNSLGSLPDISNWDISNTTNLMNIFMNCSSLIELPDISKWNTEKVRNMRGMFDGCKCLSVLPDISNWKTDELINISNIFHKCSSLIKIPDISNWNIGKNTDIEYSFKNCLSLTEICSFNKWNPKKNEKFSNLFENCVSLVYLSYCYDNNIKNNK